MGNQCFSKENTKNIRYSDPTIKQPIQPKINQPIPNCQICSTKLKDNFTLKCGHTFHKKCIQDYFKTIIQSKQLTLNCPMGCGKEAQYNQIQSIIPTILFAVHEKNLLQACIQDHDQFLFCPTGSCVGIYEIAGEDFQYFECFFCKKQYCLICRKVSHGQNDCDFGEEILSRAAMTKAGMKPCPYCKHMVEKIEGCNAVVCRCGNQFCYDCGGTTCPHGTCINKK